MMKLKHIITILAITFLLTNCKKESVKNENTTKTKNFTDSIVSVLNKKVPKWQNELNIPNVGIGIIDNGEIKFTKVFSTKQENSQEDMLFNIASITKVIFGTTVMKLAENDSWDLDEPLYKYYLDEDIKDDPRHKQLTSRHALSQQSGFVNWRWNHPTKKLTFDFDPGTKFNYSGEGMEYVRKAIESKLDKSWGKIADSLLIKPMKLNNTSHSWDGKTNYSQFSRFYDSEGKEHILEDYSFTAQAADDVMTTVKDLSHFGISVMSQSYLTETTFNTMVTKETEINDNQDQAIAWRLISNLENGEYAIHHGGNDLGVATLLVLLPKSKRGVVVLTNADAGIVMCNNVVREVFKEGKEIIHRAYRSGSVDEIPESIKLSKEILDTYVGVYEQPSGRIIDISNTGEALLMKMAGVPNFQLFPKTNESFFLMDFDPIINFEIDKENKITLSIVEGENTIVCKKIE